MSREEAIKELTELLPEEFLSKYTEAIKMGIEALEQEPCDDCISRKQAIELFVGWWSDLLEYHKEDECFDALLKALPPVTPQPKMGKWIDIMVGDMPAQACDQCNVFYPLAYTGGGHKFCPNCGAKMQEVEG